MVSRIRLLPELLMISLLLAGPIVLSGQEAQKTPETCDGPYKGKRLSPEELANVLALQDKWRNHKPGGQKANLCEADLKEANLQGADLSGASLQGAHLERANLQDAFLTKANLQGAFLEGTNLQEAQLGMANLQEADLMGAHLQEAFLEGANLQEASLEVTILQRARLTQVDLTETLYEPRSLPDKVFLGGIQGLSTVWFRQGQQASLVLLREALKEVGLRSLEREATYALKHTERCYNWPGFCHSRLQDRARKTTVGFFAALDGMFHFLFFELTCAYGLTPGRPLVILLGLVPCFALLYMAALRVRGRGGIWVCWSSDRVDPQEGDDKPTRLTSTFLFPRWQARASGRWWSRFLRWGCVPLVGLYFSLLSAFHVGWRDFNVGTWIARMQPREYSLRATGWVRSVSGFQSLISVYLLALWALTYFGRPFE